jgi:hypothetical protein
MRGLLFGVDGRDPLTFATIAALLCGAAVAASYVPARRAARIDPMTSLRSDERHIGQAELDVQPDCPYSSAIFP